MKSEILLTLELFGRALVYVLALSASPALAGGALPLERAGTVPTYGYEVVGSWPHDSAAYTQGLVFANGVLYESTGRHGASSVRVVDLTTGRVMKKVDLPAAYFGEGLAILHGKIFQLTWRNGKGFIYARDTLQRLGEFRYHGEGWGLTTDGRSLIMSDGSHRLRFLDPRTFAVQRTVAVHDEHGRPLNALNELEYIKGEIYANVWQRDVIARIDPATGKVRGWIDLTGLWVHDAADAVLNGIAYDREHDRIFVTGKLWPKLFEIRLKKRTAGG